MEAQPEMTSKAVSDPVLQSARQCFRRLVEKEVHADPVQSVNLSITEMADDVLAASSPSLAFAAPIPKLQLQTFVATRRTFATAKMQICSSRHADRSDNFILAPPT